MAVPDTIDTSCSADGPPKRTTTGGSGRGRASRHAVTTASRPSRRGTRSRTRGRRRGARRRPRGRGRPAGGRPRRVPFWSLTMKLACFSDTTAPPIRVPLRPASSMSRPAESPAGLRKTLPADGRPSGWCAWRQRRMSSRRALIVSGSAAAEAERRVEDELRGPVRRRVLEPACRGRPGRGPRPGRSPPSRPRPRIRGRSRGPPATSDSWAPALAHTAPPTRARDRQPELEAGQPGPLGLGRGPGHRDAGLGRVAVAVDAASPRPGPG